MGVLWATVIQRLARRRHLIFELILFSREANFYSHIHHKFAAAGVCLISLGS